VGSGGLGSSVDMGPQCLKGRSAKSPSASSPKPSKVGRKVRPGRPNPRTGGRVGDQPKKSTTASQTVSTSASVSCGNIGRQRTCSPAASATGNSLAGWPLGAKADCR